MTPTWKALGTLRSRDSLRASLAPLVSVLASSGFPEREAGFADLHMPWRFHCHARLALSVRQASG